MATKRRHRRGEKNGLEPLVPVHGGRLREARRVRGLSDCELVAALPDKQKVVRSQIGHWERGRIRQGRADVLHALARALGVSAAWLRGENVFPISFRGWSIHPDNLTGEVRGIGLRRALVVKRCLDAARRDYELLNGRKAEGEEWTRREHLLFLQFWALLDPLYTAHRFLKLPATPGPHNAPPMEEECVRIEEMVRHLAEYWERELEPWFDGRVGFDTEALPDPFKVYLAPECTGGPRALAEAAPKRRRTPHRKT